MTIPLIKVGNSRGLRLPKSIIEQCDLEDEVQLEVKDRTLLISAVKQPRTGWEESFATMHAQGEDTLLDAETPATWDTTEWEWR